jgi:hypothetical protein
MGSERSSIFLAVLLIVLGVLFLTITIIPGMNLGIFWPLIFILLAVGFYLPSMIWYSARRELAALFIPGSVMLSLGIIFLYNVISGDWVIWAFGWLIIPAGVGLGLILAAWVGRWSRSTVWVGIWMLVINLALLSIFGILFGGPLLKSVGPIVLVASGLILLVRSLFSPRRND